MGVKHLWFYLKLYPAFLSRNIQGTMSYKSDFFLGAGASILMQSLGFVFLWAVFRDIPQISGWSFYQMVFVYGMAASCLGLNEFLFAGSWNIGRHIREGSLDRLLLRPVSTMFSVLADGVGLHGLGSVLFGIAVCIVSLNRLHAALSLGKLLFWILVVMCGALIFFSINLICAALAFWVTDSQSAMILFQNVSEFGKYPISIYDRKLQILLTYVIPFGFCSYYPATFLLDMDSKPIYWLGPIAAAGIMLAVAGVFWHFALEKYQSAGG